MQVVGSSLEPGSSISRLLARSPGVWISGRSRVMSIRGVLQHGGEHHHRAACCPGQQQIAAADAELGATRGDFIDGVGARPRLPQGDLQAGLPVNPLAMAA